MPGAGVAAAARLSPARRCCRRSVRWQYYAQPSNAFWRIFGELVKAGPDLSYAPRLEVLIQHRIALWDVCAAAERVGALDAAMSFERKL